MQIISHRGFWLNATEKNSLDAFQRSFEFGFGTETDVRDFNGELVVAHDIPSSDCIYFQEFCEIFSAIDKNLPLAINIKSDGLANLLKYMLEQYSIENYFLFDMSIPDLRHSILAGLNCYTRMSDVEKNPTFYDDCNGVWLDGFYSDWYEPQVFWQLLNDKKKICLVSSELHSRSNKSLWEMLRSSKLCDEKDIMLCTDEPQVAKEFFFKAM
jgi:hypothetical protein